MLARTVPDGKRRTSTRPRRSTRLPLILTCRRRAFLGKTDADNRPRGKGVHVRASERAGAQRAQPPRSGTAVEKPERYGPLARLRRQLEGNEPLRAARDAERRRFYEGARDGQAQRCPLILGVVCVEYLRQGSGSMPAGVASPPGLRGHCRSAPKDDPRAVRHRLKRVIMKWSVC